METITPGVRTAQEHFLYMVDLPRDMQHHLSVLAYDCDGIYPGTSGRVNYTNCGGGIRWINYGVGAFEVGVDITPDGYIDWARGACLY